MMDWLSSASDMCCRSVIERRQLEHRAAAEDCVNVHDTPSDGEVCVSTGGEDCYTCWMWWSVQQDFALRGLLCALIWETWILLLLQLRLKIYLQMTYCELYLLYKHIDYNKARPACNLGSPCKSACPPVLSKFWASTSKHLSFFFRIRVLFIKVSFYFHVMPNIRPKIPLCIKHQK